MVEKKKKKEKKFISGIGRVSNKEAADFAKKRSKVKTGGERATLVQTEREKRGLRTEQEKKRFGVVTKEAKIKETLPERKMELEGTGLTPGLGTVENASDINTTLLGGEGTASAITAEDISDVASIGMGVGIVGGIAKGTGKVIAKKFASKVGIRVTSQVGKKAVLTTERSYIGKGGENVVDDLFKKIGKEKGAIATAYKTNTKSKGLTNKMLLGIGLGTSAVFLFEKLYSTYPFAGFQKLEAQQVLGTAMFQALSADDFESADRLSQDMKEILATEDTLMEKLPHNNVRKSVQITNKALGEAIKEYDILIAEGLASAGVDEFAEQRAKRDEEAKQRELLEMEWKAEYYELIREGKHQEAEDLLEIQMKGGE